jgi:PAS domain-containing protein
MKEKNKNLRDNGSENIPSYNELFSDIFGKSAIGTLFYDEKGKLVSINRSALHIFGIRDLNHIKDINLFNFPWIDLDYKNKLERDGFVEFESVIDLGFRKSELYISEHEEIHYTIWTIKHLKSSGYLVQIQDITRQKQAENSAQESEKRYLELFNNPLNGFVILEVITNTNKKPLDFI